MDTKQSTAQHHARHTTRTTAHHRADQRFLDLFEEDFGIRAFHAYALEGIPKKQAIAVAQWAAENIADDEGRGEAIVRWARKRRVGRYDRRLVDAPPATYDRVNPDELEGV